MKRSLCSVSTEGLRVTLEGDAGSCLAHVAHERPGWASGSRALRVATADLAACEPRRPAFVKPAGCPPRGVGPWALPPCRHPEGGRPSGVEGFPGTCHTSSSCLSRFSKPSRSTGAYPRLADSGAVVSRNTVAPFDRTRNRRSKAASPSAAEPWGRATPVLLSGQVRLPSAHSASRQPPFIRQQEEQSCTDPASSERDLAAS